MAGNINPLETVAVAVVDGNINNNINDRKKLKKIVGAKLHYPKYLILGSTIISYFLALTVLACTIWLISIRQFDCENILELPRLQIAIIIGLIIVFVINIMSTYFRARFPVLGLLVVMIPVMLMFTEGLGLIGSFKTESKMVPGSPSWLKAKVGDEYNWNNIKSCVYDTRTCDDLVERSYMMKAFDFNKLKLSVIENGCCRPPKHCNMDFVNATYWKKNDYNTGLRTASYGIDCELWRNNENMLCYNCYSCKDGFRKMIQGKWWRLGNFLVAMAVLHTISHLCLFIGTMWEQHHHSH